MKKAIFALMCFALVGSSMSVASPGFDNDDGKNIFESEKFNASVEQNVETMIIRNDVVEIYVLSARVDSITGEVEFLKSEFEKNETSTLPLTIAIRSNAEDRYECLFNKNLSFTYNYLNSEKTVSPSLYSKSWYLCGMRS